VANLDAGWLKSINYFKEIPSTQDYAMEMARSGAEEGTLVVSETQGSGRGRKGSAWFSPKGGLWFSFILRPELAQLYIPTLSLSMGLAVCRGIERLTGLDVSIKWPNDIYLENRKLAGVLADMEADSGKVRYVVIGVGINTNVDTSDYLPELKGNIVSLAEAGHSVDNLELMGLVLEEAGKIYGVFKESGFGRIIGDIKHRCRMLGKTIKVTDRSFGKTIQGQAFDITERGGLLIRSDSGIMMEMFSGSAEVL
jgi:BirA family biotin operon repressor/biotin-[acetyl-CoA-carboxylase] ligase